MENKRKSINNTTLNELHLNNTTLNELLDEKKKKKNIFMIILMVLLVIGGIFLYFYDSSLSIYSFLMCSASTCISITLK